MAAVNETLFLTPMPCPVDKVVSERCVNSVVGPSRLTWEIVLLTWLVPVDSHNVALSHGLGVMQDCAGHADVQDIMIEDHTFRRTIRKHTHLAYRKCHSFEQV